MLGQAALDRRRCNVLSFAGFELLLYASDDARLAIRIYTYQIACTEVAVAVEGTARGLRLLVVAHHVHRALHQKLAAFREARFHTVECRPNVARPYVRMLG